MKRPKQIDADKLLRFIGKEQRTAMSSRDSAGNDKGYHIGSGMVDALWRVRDYVEREMKPAKKSESHTPSPVKE